MKLARWLATFTMASSACAAGANATRVSEERTAPASASAVEPQHADAQADASGQAAADQAIAAALSKVSTARELAPLGPVKGRVIALSEMVAHVDRDLDEDTPPEVARGTTDLLYALGTVADSFDYRASVLELMRAELMGFYAPREKTMFLRGDLQGTERDATLWHELVHALQDQHYDLEKLIAYRADAGDEQSAVHALAEGDATSVMLDVVLSDKNKRAIDIDQPLLDMQSAVSAGTLQQVPPILKRSIIAPYLDGLAFVNALRRRGGWAAVDAAWRRLPTSTEQLLHLEKYDAEEQEVVLETPPAPDGNATQPVFSDVFGEQGLRILFDEWMPAGAAAEAASDWSGDHLAVFAENGRTEVGWHLRFDSRMAADRALIAFGRGVLAKPLPNPGDRLPDFVTRAEGERVTRSARVCQERPSRGPFAVIRRGSDLAVVLGPFWRNSRSAMTERACKDALSWAERILGKVP